MISEYLDKETVIAQLKQQFPRQREEWDVVLDKGVKFKDFIAYPIKYGDSFVWLLTDYMTGVVTNVVFSPDLEYGYSHGLMTE